ncbi:MAG: plasmid stabilization protein [Propionibacterium sp.]|nr:plasmid stabilization protein [Propionibacterium sp.]
MSTITIRNLDDDVTRRLRIRAAAHGHSMEAEVRAILTGAVAGSTHLGRALIEMGESVGGVELEIPERSPARPVDLE